MTTAKQSHGNPIHVINKRLFRKNKGRNLAAVLAIIMTTLMFTTLLTLALSMNENLVEMTFRQVGYDAQASIKQLSPQQAEALSSHPGVKDLGTSIVLGLGENKRLAGRQVEIRWGSDSYAAHSFAAPTTGRMPQAENEVALDTLVLDRLGIPHELGQKVTLEWRKNLPDPEETPLQSEFTLCGFWEGNISVYASMAWVSRSYADQMTQGIYNQKDSVLGQFMAQITLDSDKKIQQNMDQILADTGMSDLEYSVNLAYSPEMGATALQETLPMYAGMILVFIAGYLIIYNIFQIGVTADIQFYGQLKTLGTTGKQIRWLIFGQSNRLCMIGIPLGLVSGWLLGVVLVPAFTGIVEGGGRASVNPAIFIGSAIFAWITVTVSCLHPAHLAGRISPIEALRISDSDGKTKRKVRKNTKVVSIRSMAWANLWRNKKRTITVICSLTLGFVLLSCFYAKNAAFDMEKYLENLTIADFELEDVTSSNYISGYDPQGTTLSDSLVQNVEALKGVEKSGHQYSHQLLWSMDDQTLQNIQNFYTEDMLNDWASYDPGAIDAFHKVTESREINTVVFGLDGIPLEKITQSNYILDGSFDAEAFASGDYILAMGFDLDEDYDKTYPVPSVGSIINLEGKEYTVMAVVYPLEPVDDGASEKGAPESMELHMILPTSAFRENWPDNTLRRLFLDVSDEHLDEASQWLEQYTETTDSSLPVTSRQSMTEQYKTETRSSAVMGNAISIIISLVGILNFVNSMVTAILSRKREFAMIQSIGMTKRQLLGMLIWEGIYYAAITLTASCLISSLAVGIGIRALVSGGFTTFHFTLMPLAVCMPFLFLFAVLLPYICFRNLEKESIVERLRAIN